MSQCLNPDCLGINPEHHRFCQQCGKPLLLKDRYQALRLIGQGGFGKTFLAIDHDKPSKPRCVIKQFFPQIEGTNDLAKAEELFSQEAQRLDELGHHDQIPALMAYFTLEGRQYLVQEYIEGKNLEQELKQDGVFDQKKVTQLLLDLLPVLDFIHRIPVIHRDIKPENIIRRASDQKLVLVDFGAAKRVTPINRSVTGTMIGSAEYVAPEQLNGKAVLASDLYSLGVTCLYLLTGVSPFELFDSGEFEWVWRDYLVNNSIDNNLGTILDRLVTPGIKKRYQSVESVLKNLKKAPVSRNSKKLSIQGSIFEQEKTSNNRPCIIKEFSEKITKRSLLGSQFFDLKLVSLPSGELIMGSNDNPEESPEHIVKLKRFAIGQYPITQEQYRIVTGQSISHFKQSPLNPVEKVNWFDATNFCKKISELTGKKYRLPTEAEWEYAFRAGNQKKYSFGNSSTPKPGRMFAPCVSAGNEKPAPGLSKQDSLRSLAFLRYVTGDCGYKRKSASSYDGELESLKKDAFDLAARVLYYQTMTGHPVHGPGRAKMVYHKYAGKGTGGASVAPVSPVAKEIRYSKIHDRMLEFAMRGTLQEFIKLGLAEVVTSGYLIENVKCKGTRCKGPINYEKRTRWTLVDGEKSYRRDRSELGWVMELQKASSGHPTYTWPVEGMVDHESHPEGLCHVDTHGRLDEGLVVVMLLLTPHGGNSPVLVVVSSLHV